MNNPYIVISNIDGVEYGIKSRTVKAGLCVIESDEQKVKDYREAKYKVDNICFQKGFGLDGNPYYRIINIVSNYDSDVITFIQSRGENFVIVEHGEVKIITEEEYKKHNKFEINNAKLTQKEYNEYLGIEEDKVVLARFKDETKKTEETAPSEVVEPVKAEIETTEETEKLPIPFECYKILLENAPTGDVMTLPKSIFYEGDKKNTIKIKKAKVCDSNHSEKPNIHWIAVLNGFEKPKIVAFVEWYDKQMVKLKVLRCLEDNLTMDVYDTYVEYYRSGNMLSL